MMKRSPLSAVAIAALTTTAFAADLPSRRAPAVFVPPPPVFSWAGFYVGGQIGYAFIRDNAFIDGTTVGARQFPYSNSLRGVAGGAHAGYNYVLPGNFGFGSGLIVGLEGDVNGLDLKKAEDFGVALGTPAGLFLNNVKSNIQGSVRGRVGVAFDRALFYATGGVAVGGFKSSYTATIVAPFPNFPASFSTTRVGYTVGGGVEYAITPNWSLRAEGRYTDFGTFSDPTLFLAGGNVVPIRHKETEATAQIGFSYRFDAPLTPVVARY